LNYLHKEFDAKQGDIVYVELDKQANIKLIDSLNYQNYRNGLNYRYYGGLAKITPAKIPVPYQGHWHVVIDLGGYSGTVRALIKIIKRV